MWCEAQLRLCFPTSFFGCRISPQRAGLERVRACDHLTPFFRRSTTHLEPQSDARIIKKVPAGNATPARVLALPQNVARTTHTSVVAEYKCRFYEHFIWWSFFQLPINKENIKLYEIKIRLKTAVYTFFDIRNINWILSVIFNLYFKCQRKYKRCFSG